MRRWGQHTHTCVCIIVVSVPLVARARTKKTPTREKKTPVIVVCVLLVARARICGSLCTCGTCAPGGAKRLPEVSKGGRVVEAEERTHVVGESVLSQDELVEDVEVAFAVRLAEVLKSQCAGVCTK